MRLVLEVEEMIGTGVSHPGRRTSSKDGCIWSAVSVRCGLLTPAHCTHAWLVCCVLAHSLSLHSRLYEYSRAAVGQEGYSPRLLSGMAILGASECFAQVTLSRVSYCPMCTLIRPWTLV